MELSSLFMVAGFMLAAYAVIANDSIQTLGTFMYSNQDRKWWILFIFAGTVMVAAIVTGWVRYNGDPSWNRLEDYAHPAVFNWAYVVPPLVLLIITRFGIPVSTSFLILTFFALAEAGGGNVIDNDKFQDVLKKSVGGYGLAMGLGLLVYSIVVFHLEKLWRGDGKSQKPPIGWVIAQWCSTGFLWWMWLAQDMANIFVYLGSSISLWVLGLCLLWLLAIQAFMFREKGGKIQEIVRQKTNTADIRSATIIDFVYACLLFYKLTVSTIPMSTTWVFVGLLAGRELGFAIRQAQTFKEAGKLMGKDILKVTAGLGISIILAIVLVQFTPQAQDEDYVPPSEREESQESSGDQEEQDSANGETADDVSDDATGSADEE